MPLPADRTFQDWSQIPADSRPSTPVEDIGSLPGGQGARHRARTAGDGTRWCLTCMRTLDPMGRAALCPTCTRERHRIRQGLRRRTRGQGSVPIPLAVIEQLDGHVARLERHIGQVLSAQHCGADPSEAHRLLTIASKEMSRLVTSEFLPRLAAAHARDGVRPGP